MLLLRFRELYKYHRLNNFQQSIKFISNLESSEELSLQKLFNFIYSSIHALLSVLDSKESTSSHY